MKFECKLCRYETNSKNSYLKHESSRKHLLKVQEDKKNAKSSSKSKKSSSSKKESKKESTGKYLCHHCDEEFTDKNKLNKHLTKCLDLDNKIPYRKVEKEDSDDENIRVSTKKGKQTDNNKNKKSKTKVKVKQVNSDSDSDSDSSSESDSSQLQAIPQYQYIRGTDGTIRAVKQEAPKVSKLQKTSAATVASQYEETEEQKWQREVDERKAELRKRYGFKEPESDSDDSDNGFYSGNDTPVHNEESMRTKKMLEARLMQMKYEEDDKAKKETEEERNARMQKLEEDLQDEERLKHVQRTLDKIRSRKLNDSDFEEEGEKNVYRCYQKIEENIDDIGKKGKVEKDNLKLLNSMVHSLSQENRTLRKKLRNKRRTILDIRNEMKSLLIRTTSYLIELHNQKEEEAIKYFRDYVKKESGGDFNKFLKDLAEGKIFNEPEEIEGLNINDDKSYTNQMLNAMKIRSYQKEHEENKLEDKESDSDGSADEKPTPPMKKKETVSESSDSSSDESSDSDSD